MKPTIHLVVGARPNYIKANPVFQRLDELDKFDLVLVNTGQHYDHNMVYDIDLSWLKVKSNIKIFLYNSSIKAS